MKLLVLSKLPHTWILDLDGTILLHNGHLRTGDVLLPGVEDFWRTIPDSDAIILLSARDENYRIQTENFLSKNNLRFDSLIMGLPKGERIQVNDKKPGGLETSISVNVERDVGLEKISFYISDVI